MMLERRRGAIAPGIRRSIWITRSGSEIYGVSGASMHFPRMSEINGARARPRRGGGKGGFRGENYEGKGLEDAGGRRIASDEITIPPTRP